MGLWLLPRRASSLALLPLPCTDTIATAIDTAASTATATTTAMIAAAAEAACAAAAAAHGFLAIADRRSVGSRARASVGAQSAACQGAGFMSAFVPSEFRLSHK